VDNLQNLQTPAPDLISPGEAAGLLGVTTTTLANWAAVGTVECVRLPSGHRRYVRSSIEALATERRAS
jgi:predicted site-specific integrase-resolvase